MTASLRGGYTDERRSGADRWEERTCQQTNWQNSRPQSSGRRPRTARTTRRRPNSGYLGSRHPRISSPSCTSLACASSPRAQRRCFSPTRRTVSDSAQSLLVSVDLPVDARVVEASPGRPYLAVRISLDPAVVGELLADSTPASPLGPPSRGLAVTPVALPLLDAVTRLVALLNSPQDVAPLAPLVLREITYRLLAGPQGRGCARSLRPAPRPSGSRRLSGG